MQTLKTALVVTFLLAVLYGVYVTLNKPELAGDDHALDDPQQWAEPSVELSGLSGDSPSFAPGDLGEDSAAPAGYSPRQGSDFPLPSFDAATPAPHAELANGYANSIDAPPLAESNASGGNEHHGHEHADHNHAPAGDYGAVAQGSYIPSGETGRAVSNGNSAPNNNDAGVYSIGDQDSPYANTRNDNPSYGGATASDDNAPPPYSPYDATESPAEQTDAASRTSLAEYKFKESWATTQQYLNENRFARALATLTELYRENDLTVEHRRQLLDMLDRLAGTVIYSTEHRLEQPYEVERGETLEQIAEQFQVPSELLFNINRSSINEPDLLLPGTQLKVMRGPFRAEISINGDDPSHGEATLFLGSLYAGRFPVSFGDDVPTPGRTYHVTERLEGKPFYQQSGPPQPARSPGNPYGLYWLGFDDRAVGIHSLGRHGGEEDRRGSIRLHERDAADVFGILSIGSAVKVLQ